MSLPNHTILRYFTFDGVQEFPREAEPLYEHQGDTLEAGDGTGTNIYRSSKRRWEFTWESPRPEVVERWRGYYTARLNRAFVDPYLQSYTAFIPVRQFRFRAVYLPGSTNSFGAVYKLTVQLWEV